MRKSSEFNEMYLIHRRSHASSTVLVSKSLQKHKTCENHSPDVFMAKNIDGSET